MNTKNISDLLGEYSGEKNEAKQFLKQLNKKK